MRQDLTENFLITLSQNGRKPIQLATFHFEFGSVYISDRDITVDGNEYKGLVTDWGQLATVGDVSEENAESMQLALSIWNGGPDNFSRYFDIEDPVNVFVTLQQTFEGLEPEDIATIGEFVLQDPISFDEASQIITVDLVTTNIRYFAQVGELLTKEKYPYALETDLNKPINLIVGNAGQVKAVCSYSPPRATLTGSFLKLPTRVYVHEDLDELLFDSTGYIQIDDEIMHYNGRTSNYFYVDIRGTDGTIATDHSDGATIIQARKHVDYIVGQGPLNTIMDVRAEGQLQSGNYTLYPNNDPAFIRFSKQPTYVEYSKGARSIDVDFDSHNISTVYSNALNPEYAYQKDKRTLGAVIGKNNRILSLNQIDAAEDEGEIVKIFLCIEHWATKHYKNNIVRVYNDGVGHLGNLSRPNPDFEIDLSGITDIDHGHDHEEGGSHDHTEVQPDFGSVSPGHAHVADIVVDKSRNISDFTFEVSGTTYNTTKSITINCGYFGTDTQNQQYIYNIDVYIVADGSKCNWIKISSNFGSTQRIHDDPQNGDTISSAWYPPGISTGKTLELYVSANLYAGDALGGATKVRLTFSRQELKYEQVSDSVLPTAATVNTSRTQNVNVNVQNIDTSGGTIAKEKADVKDLSLTDGSLTERELEIILKDNASLAVVQKFDITERLESANWDYMTGIKSELLFITNDSSEDAEIVIPYMWYEVEYRQRQIKTTDNVTAYVIGDNTTINNRPDAVIQYLLTQKAGVPASVLGSVWRQQTLWDDGATWWDKDPITGENNVWLDGGEEVEAPAGALFEQAASWYAYKGYTVDGVIPGNISVKEAINQLTWQFRSRLFWQNGKCKLSIKRKSENWTIARELTPDDLQLRSVSVQRSRVDKINNKIDLFYDVDRLSDAEGSGAFNKSANVQDLTSINKHGERKEDDLFFFDLIRNTNTANDIADYYLWALGETTSLFTFNTYLNNFFLEKGDYITLTTSGFSNANGLPLDLREVSRVFGNAKTKQINLLNITGESIRHYNFIVNLPDDSRDNDTIVLTDTLVATIGLNSFLEDAVHLTDQLLIISGKYLEDDLLLSDEFSIIADYAPALTETLLITDELATEMVVELGSGLTLDDSLNVSQELCFGACGFGCPDGIGPSFGSPTSFQDAVSDYVAVTDELLINLTTYLEDEISLTDELVFSDGFGCVNPDLSSGFGLSPFGDNNCTP